LAEAAEQSKSQKEGNYDAEKPMTQGYPQEMLDPELQDYVQRGVLCHPCVVSVSIDRKRACTGNAIANEQFRHTKAAILDAKQSGDWEKYVILHVRPYRLEAPSRPPAFLIYAER
jgi:hypothetical protein